MCDLAREEASRPGVSVEVACVAQGGAGWERDGRVGVLRVPGQGVVASNPLSCGIAAALRQSSLSRRHHLWHFHYPFPTGELSLLAASAGTPRPPAVCTYHSDFVGDSPLKRSLSLPYARLTRAFLGAVDAVIASSPQLAGNSRFLPEVTHKVHVIPFGIDARPLRPTPALLAQAAALRRRLGEPLLLFVGRFVPYKGVDVLLRAFAKVPRGVLLLVGEGPLRGALERTVRELGLGERVVFAGSLEQEELAAAYHAADVLVLPSVTPNEAFGLVQLEAHACGVPVISTSLPTGVPFANLHGVSGLVVRPGQAEELAGALSLLLEDEALRRRLGRQAQARFERDFSLARMTDRVLELYEGLLAQRNAGGEAIRRGDSDREAGRKGASS